MPKFKLSLKTTYHSVDWDDQEIELWEHEFRDMEAAWFYLCTENPHIERDSAHIYSENGRLRLIMQVLKITLFDNVDATTYLKISEI